MENSRGKPGGAKISRKTKLLDLQTLYKSECSKEGHHTEKNGSNDDDDEIKKKKKRKSRKEVALSIFEPAGKNSRRPFDEDYPEGFKSCSNDSVKGHLGLSQNTNSGNGANGIAFSLDGNSNGNVICVPKRPRGSVWHKKTEASKVAKPPRPTISVDQVAMSNSERKKLHGNHVFKTSGFSSSKPGSSEPKDKLTGNSLGYVVPSIIKQECGDIKEKTGGVNSDQNAKEGDGHLSSVNSGNVSSRKHRKNHKKNMDFGSDSKSGADKVELSPNTSSRICGNFEDDDDEENLEQNAARMLSSRFDPSCTGFPTKSKPLQSTSANSLSFLIPFRDFGSREKNHICDTDMASVDTVSRVLRPRKQHMEKGVSRKRRHFYEILPRDLDAYWVLNSRIKVFWPLDQSWYYGLVDNYDPEKNLHHIKYDDRDEEWINLHNERFKLLLLPSEVPGNAKPNISDTGDTNFEKGKNNFSIEEDSYLGSYMDSEPIISWLARSSRRVKYSSSRALKKQKLVHLSSQCQQRLSGKSDYEHEEDGFVERGLTESFFESVLPDISAESSSDQKSVAEVSISSKDSKCHIVYFRRRSRKKCVNKNKGGSLPGPDSSFVPVIDTFQPVKKDNLSLEQMGSAELFWVTDDAGFLNFSLPLVECKQFKFELCFPLPSVVSCTSGAEDVWLLHTLYLLRHGTMVTVWPKVHVEMLFVDNIVGLRFLLFEGYLKQAVAFIFLILTVFHQPNEQWNFINLEMPVTSIRFKLSHVQDLRKQHVFEFCSFCRLKNSLWWYLYLKFQQYCFTNQLPMSECTYDKTKTLEGGNNQLQVEFVTGNSVSMEDSWKKSVQAITTLGVSKESYNVNSNRLLYGPDVKHSKLPPFALSFAAAPTFFLSLHLRLLMERSIAFMNLQSHNSLYLLGCAEKACTSTSDDCSRAEDDNAPQLTVGSDRAACTGYTPCTRPHMEVDTFSASSGSRNAKLSESIEVSNLAIALPPACSKELGNNSIDLFVQSQKLECSDPLSVQSITSQVLLVPQNHSPLSTSHFRWNPSLNCMNVEIPSFDQFEKALSGGSFSTYHACDSPWNVNDGFSESPIPSGPRSLWQCSRNSPSSLFHDLSPVCSAGKTNFISNSFSNGPKRPRTQVHYTLPYGGFYFGSKHRVHSQKVLPFKRIRTAYEKAISDGSRTSQKNLELLACDANVLITHGDRGWRECGARIVLELAGRNEWMLAVKLSGMTRYSYKVHHVLQPGLTNRYTHAMTWKGGKDWGLEFPDRSQWMLFKEMHEECYNRNIRAASVRNIPIPGVHSIEECDDSAIEVLFVRGSPKYFRQVETDADMAMDPSRILYDMDSDDEQWLSRNGDISDVFEGKEISEDLFERAMDTFEKVAYAQKRDYFTSNELEEFMAGAGPMEVIKIIYEHWEQKRKKKGMPLIRHLQPPLWESYQQQVKEWEHAVVKSGGGEGKAPLLDRPPMFAFCLKPRGLETPNKGSKQRSQKKFHVFGHGPSVPGDHDGVRAFGRRSNGFLYGDEKVIFSGVGHERVNVSPVLQASTRAFSQLDAGGSGYFSLNNDMSEWNHYPKLYRNKSKKIATSSSSGNPHNLSSYNQRTAKGNGVNRSIMGLPEHPSQRYYQAELSLRHGIQQLDGSDLEEFRLRDASGAARHALNVAKIKRERAHKLLCRADEAIHKAMVALMTAEAVKASFEDSNDGG